MAPQCDGWRRDLYIVIFESETRMGRIFDVVLLWAIILSVFSIILESEKAIEVQYGVLLHQIEWFFTGLFTVEYVLRLICVRKPTHYARSFFGIVDFISLVPTYLSLFITGTHFLMVIRAVRLLRVFRILKLARYLQESEVLMDALKASRVKITVFIGAVLTVVLIMGTFMHLIEHDNPGFSSIFSSMYWAIVTMTTVGYGDIVPNTILGKFLASVIMIMGYGILAVPTGIVSAELSHAKGKKRRTGHCKSCNEYLIRKAKFCHHCGRDVDGDED